MECEEILEFIKERWEEFQRTEFHSFSEFVNEDGKPKRGALNFGGVYVIYEGNKPIYVGSSGKGKRTMRKRIGDLFEEPKIVAGKKKYRHTLTKKLLENKYLGYDFNSIDEVRNFYFSKCSLRILKIDSLVKARLIEHALIALLEPRFNEEVEDDIKKQGLKT